MLSPPKKSAPGGAWREACACTFVLSLGAGEVLVGEDEGADEHVRVH